MNYCDCVKVFSDVALERKVEKIRNERKKVANGTNTHTNDTREGRNTTLAVIFLALCKAEELLNKIIL
jgi:hypothetical protein